jgi:hypothetical protein
MSKAYEKLDALVKSIPRRRSLNREALRKLARKLRGLRHEEHYSQGSWCNKTACGTAACIAGHLAIQAGLSPRVAHEVSGHIAHVANRLLGPVNTSRLFFAWPEIPFGILDTDPAWPAPFSDRWRAAKWNMGERPSRIAADLLDAIADGKVKIEPDGRLRIVKA